MIASLLVLGPLAFVPHPPVLGFHMARTQPAVARFPPEPSALKLRGGAATATVVTPPTTEVVAASEPVEKPEGSRALLTRTMPLLVGLAAVLVGMAKVLAGATGPVAGGLKLIYAGAIAGIISRSACAPLEMVSTVMMCRGDECKSMMGELKDAWKTEGLGGLFKGNGLRPPLSLASPRASAWHTAARA
jgi:hypothetical protein